MVLEDGIETQKTEGFLYGCDHRAFCQLFGRDSTKYTNCLSIGSFYWCVRDFSYSGAHFREVNNNLSVSQFKEYLLKNFSNQINL